MTANFPWPSVKARTCVAANLTGWHLTSPPRPSCKDGHALFNLQHMEGISETLAQAVYNTGFTNVFEVAEAPMAELKAIPGFSNGCL